MAWVCNKCGVEMEEADDIAITYNGMDLPEAEGLRCPSCGAEFLDEELVVTELNDAEQMLEAK
ncbi:MAG: DNA-binding protein [Clostridiales bacterium]|nr:MAG: DNA-binding protein [Clostridiales bacterium]